MTAQDRIIEALYRKRCTEESDQNKQDDKLLFHTLLYFAVKHI